MGHDCCLGSASTSFSICYSIHIITYTLYEHVPRCHTEMHCMRSLPREGLSTQTDSHRLDLGGTFNK